MRSGKMENRRPVGRPPHKPQFDHSKQVTTAISNKGKFLVQDGVRYTFAEYNKFTEQWEPEPRPVNEAKEARKELEPAIKDMTNKLEEIRKQLEKFNPLFEKVLEDGE